MIQLRQHFSTVYHHIGSRHFAACHGVGTSPFLWKVTKGLGAINGVSLPRVSKTFFLLLFYPVLVSFSMLLFEQFAKGLYSNDSVYVA